MSSTLPATIGRHHPRKVPPPPTPHVYPPTVGRQCAPRSSSRPARAPRGGAQQPAVAALPKPKPATLETPPQPSEPALPLGPLFVAPPPKTWKAKLAAAMRLDAAGSPSEALQSAFEALSEAANAGSPQGTQHCQRVADALVGRFDAAEVIRGEGEALLDDGDVEGGLAKVEEALRLFCTEPKSLVIRARLTLERGGDLAAAAEDARGAMRANGSRTEAATIGVRALLTLGRPLDAIGMLDEHAKAAAAAAREAARDPKTKRVSRKMERAAKEQQRALESLRAEAKEMAAVQKGAPPLASDAEATGPTYASGAVGEASTAPAAELGKRWPPAEAAKASPVAAAMARRVLTDAALDTLRADGHVTLDLPIPAAERSELARQARELHTEPLHKESWRAPARGSDGRAACWIAQSGGGGSAEGLPALKTAALLLTCLVHELNERWRAPEGHAPLEAPSRAVCFAVDGQDAACRPHFDNCGGKPDDRELTLVLHLNEPWGEDDAGQLRLHPHATAERCAELSASGWQGGADGGGKAGPCVDVLPRAGGVTIFRSTLLQEVLPATAGRLRLSLTSWALRPEGAEGEAEGQ